MVGVTGTNGKTTTTCLVRHIIRQTMGVRVGLIGTIRNLIDETKLETERTTPFDYSPAQKQLTREVAAACQGALSAVAEEVLVKDAHDSARNIDPAGLPRGIKMNRSWSGDLLSMMSGLDQDK